jgi:hypothetical protein
MHENRSTESIKSDNTPAATGAVKRPYQSPTVFQLDHCLTKSGAVISTSETGNYKPSGKY